MAMINLLFYNLIKDSFSIDNPEINKVKVDGRITQGLSLSMGTSIQMETFEALPIKGIIGQKAH